MLNPKYDKCSYENRINNKFCNIIYHFYLRINHINNCFDCLIIISVVDNELVEIYNKCILIVKSAKLDIMYYLL